MLHCIFSSLTNAEDETDIFFTEEKFLTWLDAT